MTRALHLLIRGRVQGVWFRRSTQLEAERLGVVGWVRNLADGSVEARIEGPEAALEELRRWCEAGGPPHGRVDALRASPCEPEGFTRFEVRPDG